MRMPWLLLLLLPACGGEPAATSAAFFQHGAMHEAIGQGRDHGRVALREVLTKPGVYAVGALEGLEGEVTILDSTLHATGVDADGAPRRREAHAASATLLAGQAVGSWSSTEITEDVAPEEFDDCVSRLAAQEGLDLTAPFTFVVEARFEDVRLHVINGSCPIRARTLRNELPDDQRPYELEVDALSGTLVGIHARGAEGSLTHPATSTHAHLVWRDEASGEQLTGHVERLRLAPGAVVRLPSS